MSGRPRKKIKLERRKQFALVLLIQELMDQIHAIGGMLHNGDAALEARYMLRETASPLALLDEQGREAYYEFLINMTLQRRNANARAVLCEGSTAIRGAKERFISRMREELAA